MDDAIEGEVEPARQHPEVMLEPADGRGRVGAEVVRHAAQAVWVDPETGFRRRGVSPPARDFSVELGAGEAGGAGEAVAQAIAGQERMDDAIEGEVEPARHIETLSADAAEAALPDLAALLHACVLDGASIGFVRPGVDQHLGDLGPVPAVRRAGEADLGAGDDARAASTPARTMPARRSTARSATP
jgi:hypothetical protein